MLANKDHSCSSLYVQLTVHIYLTIHKVDVIAMAEAQMVVKGGQFQTGGQGTLPLLQATIVKQSLRSHT